jgi:hypothetical protein
MHSPDRRGADRATRRQVRSPPAPSYNRRNGDPSGDAPTPRGWKNDPGKSSERGWPPGFDGTRRELKNAAKSIKWSWRPRPELNWCTRFCRPLRNHSATWPHKAGSIYSIKYLSNRPHLLPLPILKSKTAFILKWTIYFVLPQQFGPSGRRLSCILQATCRSDRFRLPMIGLSMSDLVGGVRIWLNRILALRTFNYRKPHGNRILALSKLSIYRGLRQLKPAA